MAREIISIRLSPRLRRAIDLAAEEEGVTRSELMREKLRRGILQDLVSTREVPAEAVDPERGAAR